MFFIFLGLWVRYLVDQSWADKLISQLSGTDSKTPIIITLDDTQQGSGAVITSLTSGQTITSESETIIRSETSVSGLSQEELREAEKLLDQLD